MSDLIDRLWFRLAAAFLVVALTGIAVVSLLANRAAESSFNRFLNNESTLVWEQLAEDLGADYEARGDWSGAERLLARAAGPGQGQGNTILTLVDRGGNELAASRRRGQNAPDMPVLLTLPVMVDGGPGATLQVSGMGGGMGMGGGQASEQFFAEVNRAIWLGGLAAVLVAVTLGAWLAYRLTRPLTQLTDATHQMASGRLHQQVPVTDRGELGELAASFNQMAGTLALAEQQRKQLLADVAHELRTPLSVLRAQLEAMLDGILPLDLDNVALAHEETLLLGRLVDDLRTLSLAEAGQLPLQIAAVDPAEAIALASAAFGPLYEAEGVTLVTETPEELPPVAVDPQRLQQVLGNLLANALRHAPEGPSRPPTVTLSAESTSDQVVFSISDTGPGLSPEAQAQVFDRFWRGEKSRTRSAGGSGLGLAICQAIANAHGGQISVTSTVGQGTQFSVALPQAGSIVE